MPQQMHLIQNINIASEFVNEFLTKLLTYKKVQGKSDEIYTASTIITSN